MSPPPSGNVQPFQIAPVQTPDPLQTLAQMQEMRTRSLQQQQAQLGLQQQALQFRSNQAMMQAFAQGNANWDATQKLLDSSPDILPTDRMAVEQHQTQILTERAALKEKDRQNYDADAAEYRKFLLASGVNNQDGLDEANLNAENAGVSTRVPRMTTFSDPDHVKAFANSLILPSQLQAEKKTEAETTEAGQLGLKAQAEGELAKVNTQLAQHKIDLYNTLQANPQALQQRVAASIDPAKYPTLYAIALNEAKNQPDIDKMNESIQTWAKTVADIDREMNPQVRAAKIEDEIKKNTDPRMIQATLAKSPELNVTYPGLGGGANAPGGAASITPSALHGDAYLQSLQPNTAATIKGIADGRVNIDSVGRSPLERTQLQQAVMQYDPTWSENRAELRKAFTTGPEAVNIGNLNTATVHAQQFLEAAEAMKNGVFQPGNRAWNYMSRLFGSNIPTNLEAIKNAWSGEMASALKGTATDPEIASIKKGIDDVNSWDQFKGVVNENLKALGAKLNTYHERAQRTDIGDWSPILPSAREVFRQHGMDPTREAPGGGGGPAAGRGGAQIGVKDARGKTHYFNSEQDAQKFENSVKAAGGSTSRQ